MQLKQIWDDFIDLIFPRCCEACGNALIGNEKVICTMCRITLPRVHAHSIGMQVFEEKFAYMSEVKRTFSFLVFVKKGKVQRLLHALKYRNRPEIGLTLGEMLGQDLLSRQEVPPADLIISVPLHAKRLRKRGYNQSDKLAEGFSRVVGIPWSGEVLTRVRNSESQTGKTRAERRENVASIFEVKQPIQNKNVILIDDVLTTGATLEACIQALKKSGCEAFYIFTIASA
jgi:ComF family protein